MTSVYLFQFVFVLFDDVIITLYFRKSDNKFNILLKHFINQSLKKLKTEKAKVPILCYKSLKTA